MHKIPSTAFKLGQSGNPATTFKPGQSGNPGGRPAVLKNLQALAREHTEEAIEALVVALKYPATRVAAATTLLDRGYGRPVQTLNQRIIRSVADLSDEELHSILASETEVSNDPLRL
jgi:hypothetical protein